MAERETAWFRGDGGGVWPMDLPLPEHMAEQLTKGYLTRVNEDGSPWTEPVPESGPGQPPPQGGGGAAPAGGPMAPAVPRPATSASKAEWVGYAVRAHGLKPDDAEAMTKQDLIDRYGKGEPEPSQTKEGS
jgi:hypothetical protein